MTDRVTERRTFRRSLRRGAGRVLVRGCAGGAALLLGASAWGTSLPVASAAAASDAWTANYGDGGNSATNAGESVLTSAKAARIAQAWSVGGGTPSPYAPSVAGGVGYRVTSANATSYLTAFSPRTGVTSWQVALPNELYQSGLTVTGQDAIVSFNGRSNTTGGLVAVDLAGHSVLGQVFLPPATFAWMGTSEPDRPYTDGARVYVAGAGNAVNAYRLSDGGLAWTVPLATAGNGVPLAVDGIAVGNGVVYTSGAQGLIAYDASTGRRLWTGNGYRGTPVVAGGRVFLSGPTGLAAFLAAGCQATVCAPTWTSTVSAGSDFATLSGADASSVFVTYRTTQPPAPGSARGSFTGVIARLAAGTGKLQWTTSIGDYTTGLVRGGNMIWLYNEYADASNVLQERILGYSTTATGTAPLATIPLTSNLQGFPQTLAVASGTLFQQLNGPTLVGYRVPGA